jgi:hypothetical protein
VTAADRKRLAVLRHLGDVYDSTDGPRLYENMGKSRLVRAEVDWLLARDLITPEQRDDGNGYRITDAGRAQLDAWEVAA